MFLKRIIYFFIFSKKIFSKPKNKKYLIVDSDDSEILLKYFDKRQTEVMHFRAAYIKNQKLNMYVLFKNFIKFKFSLKYYYEEYVKLVNPKILVTIADNYPFIYPLKSNNLKMKKIIIQRANRTKQKTDVLYRLKELKRNKDYRFDYLLMFNKEIGKIYKSFLKGKIIPIGSFKSNSVIKKKEKKKIELLLISVFRKHLKPFKQDVILFENLKKYCEKKKLKVQVLGSTNSEVEKYFYLNIFGNQMKKFINRHKNRNPYKIVDQAKITVSIDSTLGYESAARGNKVAFFIKREKKLPTSTVQFGWPVKKKYIGPFWSDKNNLDEICRILNYLRNKKNHLKVKRTINKHFKDIMNFDEGNKKFLILKKKIIYENSKAN